MGGGWGVGMKISYITLHKLWISPRWLNLIESNHSHIEIVIIPHQTPSKQKIIYFSALLILRSLEMEPVYTKQRNWRQIKSKLDSHFIHSKIILIWEKKIFCQFSFSFCNGNFFLFSTNFENLYNSSFHSLKVFFISSP